MKSRFYYQQSGNSPMFSKDYDPMIPIGGTIMFEEENFGKNGQIFTVAEKIYDADEDVMIYHLRMNE